MPPSPDQKLEALRKRRAAIDAEVNRLQAKARAENRKHDTRRKILIGAVVMQEMEDSPDRVGAWVRNLLSERLKKPRDRALFGLDAPAPKPENQA